ncbi:MAG: lactate dehydrogenase [Anaerovorax sp.]
MEKSPIPLKGKNRVHILALGDVGGMILTGFKLLGGDVIHTIGICDVNENVEKRYEYEMNQALYPWDYEAMPTVEIVKKEQLFECDVFVFCASKAIPAVGSDVSDVRMAQFEANRTIISHYGKMAREKEFKGLFAVVSDPVDPLCKEVLISSNRDDEGVLDYKGLKDCQIQGYGLGVMNSRAAYFAKQDTRFQSFLTEGRAFGPHGSDLVIANSIENYDGILSQELTNLAVDANLRTREIGFKPYIAPAISSGAISILLTMRGAWHYSSNLLGTIFMGAKNRMTAQGVEVENIPLPEILYERIQRASINLEKIKYE